MSLLALGLVNHVLGKLLAARTAVARRSNTRALVQNRRMRAHHVHVHSMRLGTGEEVLIARVVAPDGRVGFGFSFRADGTEARHMAEWAAGVRHFDSSFGGVGGHPAKVKYGGGFTGNTCTEDLVNLFESMGIPTGIDMDGLLATAEFCEQVLGRELYGRVTRSGLNPLLKKS